MDCVEEKEAEIISALNILDTKVRELKNRLNVVSVSSLVPCCEEIKKDIKSQVMFKISSITELVDETIKNLDIF